MKEDAGEEFWTFYCSNWSKLVATLAFSVPEGEDPEDVAQEALVRAYQHWGKLRDHPDPDSWLYVTAFRRAASLARAARVRRRKLRLIEAGPRPSNPFEGTFLMDLMRELSPRQRAAVLLRHYYGLSTVETAEALGCPEGTVKSLLSRAREVLRGRIQEEVEERS